MRTTLDIEDVVLKELKAIRKREGGTLGAIVSRLLADALGGRRAQRAAEPPVPWTARDMAASVDLDDKDLVYAILDKDDHGAEP